MKLLLLLPIILTLVFASSIAFAQEFSDNTPTIPPISVTTDKAIYQSGDVIKISGLVRPVVEYFGLVTILVISPNGIVVTSVQELPEFDGTFSTTISVGKSVTMWGDYEVHAQYGFQKIKSTFVFDDADTNPFAKPEPIVEPQPIAKPEPFAKREPGYDYDSITIQGTFDRIGYGILGGVLHSVIPDNDSISLILSIDMHNDGFIIVNIPRDVLDSKFKGVEYNFTVLVDGDKPFFTETQTNTQSRTLNIKLPAGSEEIEIIGSSFERVSISKNSPCGAGTHYEPFTNSCVLDRTIEPEPIPESVVKPISESVVKPIPQWVKGIFSFYINGQINDTELLEAIKFLIVQKILVVN